MNFKVTEAGKCSLVRIAESLVVELARVIFAARLDSVALGIHTIQMKGALLTCSQRLPRQVLLAMFVFPIHRIGSHKNIGRFNKKVSLWNLLKGQHLFRLVFQARNSLQLQRLWIRHTHGRQRRDRVRNVLRKRPPLHWIRLSRSI